MQEAEKCQELPPKKGVVTCENLCFEQRVNKEKPEISEALKKAAESAALKSWNLRKPEIQNNFCI